MLLVWLGLTVLFNAERRTWGVFLAVGGLLAGAAFFVSHSVVVSQGASALIQQFRLLVAGGLDAADRRALPWYLLMLWYSGYWDDPQSRLHRRQRFWFWLPLALALLMAGLLLAANPLPDISYAANVQVERLPSVGSVPLISLTYPLYIVLCIGLALDALLRPAPSGRVMGDLARRRARPWLVGASLVLLLVSLLVGLVIAWLLQVSRGDPSIAHLIVAISTPLSVIDLLLAGLIDGRHPAAGAGDRLLRDLHRQDPAAARLSAPVAQHGDPDGRHLPAVCLGDHAAGAAGLHRAGCAGAGGVFLHPV